MRISAKVAVNSAVEARAEPVPVSVIDNYLELSAGERTPLVRIDVAGPAYHATEASYIAGDRGPVNLRKSS
jgi:hypothetical protein